MAKLNDVQINQLERLTRGEDIRSSDRPTDRARTQLKKLGLIGFDRGAFRWFITDAGRAALPSQDGVRRE